MPIEINKPAANPDSCDGCTYKETISEMDLCTISNLLSRAFVMKRCKLYEERKNVDSDRLPLQTTTR